MQRWLSWSKAHDWKSCILGIVSRVRIPLSAPTKRAPNPGALFVIWNGEGFEGRRSEWSASGAPELRPDQARRRDRIPLSASSCTPCGCLFCWQKQRGGFEGRVLAKTTVRPLPPPCSSPQVRRIPLSASFLCDPPCGFAASPPLRKGGTSCVDASLNCPPHPPQAVPLILGLRPTSLKKPRCSFFRAFSPLKGKA